VTLIPVFPKIYNFYSFQINIKYGGVRGAEDGGDDTGGKG